MIEGLNKLDDQWAPLQIKVFTRWVQNNLQGVDGVEVNDVTKDLTDGVALVELAKILTGKQPPIAWVRDPKRNVDQVQNCDLALRMFANDGCRFVNISGKDIHDGNENLTLGLIWTLILRYQLRKAVADDDSAAEGSTAESRGALPPLPGGAAAAGSDRRNKEKLYSWAAGRTASYTDLNSYKRYDLSMVALLDSYVPEKINYSNLNLNDSQAELAARTMEELGIPVYVYPEDLSQTDNKVDEKTLVTQLSAAKLVLDKLPSSRAQSAARLVESASEAPAEQEDTAAGEKKELVSDNPMHLSDVFEKRNLVSDNPMGLSEVFGVTSEPPEPLTEEPRNAQTGESAMHLSEANNRTSYITHKQVVICSMNTPGKIIDDAEIRPHIKQHRHHRQNAAGSGN